MAILIPEGGVCAIAYDKKNHVGLTDRLKEAVSLPPRLFIYLSGSEVSGKCLMLGRG